MCGAPAEAATSRSPVASTTTRPRIAWRPLLLSQTTPVMRPSSTSACENHECRRSSMRCSATISSATRLKPSGSKAAAKTIGCGLSWLVKSNAPQRVQRCSGGGMAAPFVLARKRRQVARGQALDQLEADAAHRDLVQLRVEHVVEHQHHAARGQAAEVVVALEQDGRGAVARGRDRRRHSRRAAADDDDVGARDHLDVACRLANRCRCRIHEELPGERRRQTGVRDQT